MTPTATQELCVLNGQHRTTSKMLTRGKALSLKHHIGMNRHRSEPASSAQPSLWDILEGKLVTFRLQVYLMSPPSSKCFPSSFYPIAEMQLHPWPWSILCEWKEERSSTQNLHSLSQWVFKKGSFGSLTLSGAQALAFLCKRLLYPEYLKKKPTNQRWLRLILHLILPCQILELLITGKG